MKTRAPLVEKIVSQVHETPEDAVVSALQQSVRREKNEVLGTKLNEIKNYLTLNTQRAVELASEKGASNWLTVIPIDEMGFTLNKDEFRDALKLRYDWEIADKPSICVCGDVFNVDHAMVCRRGGFIIQRHNELCLAWSAMMSRLSPSSRSSRESRCQTGLTELPTLA